MNRESKSVSQELILRPNQAAHAARLEKIFESNFGYLDTSKLGSGKTIFVLHLAKLCNLSVLVVAPLVTRNTVWGSECKKYGVDLIDCITYHALRGTKTNPPRHGFVEFVLDERAGETGHVGRYQATPKWHERVKKGVLLVFDEAQNLKNRKTKQLEAATCLVRSIVYSNCGSRVAALSGMPADKDECAESIMKMLGIQTEESLYIYNPCTFEYILTGMQEILDFARSIDTPATDKLMKGIILDRSNMAEVCATLYDKVIKARVSSSMEVCSSDKEVDNVIMNNINNVNIINDPNNNVSKYSKKDEKNAYYHLTPDDIKLVQKGFDMLAAESGFKEGVLISNKIGIKTWRQMRKSLQLIHMGKVNKVVELTIAELTSNPNSKIVIYSECIPVLELLNEKLQMFPLLMMHGKSKHNDQSIERFNRPTSEYRIMLSNPVVGGVGISLDDRNGNWPRTVFIFPSYYHGVLYQAAGRCSRGNETKSNVVIRFVYCVEFPLECQILNALARKSISARKFLANSDDGVVFPGEYETWMEEGNINDPMEDIEQLGYANI